MFSTACHAAAPPDLFRQKLAKGVGHLLERVEEAATRSRREVLLFRNNRSPSSCFVRLEMSDAGPSDPAAAGAPPLPPSPPLPDAAAPLPDGDGPPPLPEVEEEEEDPLLVAQRQQEEQEQALLEASSIQPGDDPALKVRW